MHDVVIVGSGLVGSLTALRLTDAGHRCLILDSGDGNRTASHSSAGGIYLQLQPRFDRPERIARHGAVIAPMIRTSFSAWRRLLDRIPGIPLRTTGGVILGFDDVEMAALGIKHRIERSLGLESTLLSDDDVRHISSDFSSAVRGGCFVADEGHCEPATLMRMVRNELDRLGVRMLPRCRVENLEQQSSGVVTHLVDRARLVSDRVVLATGGFTGTVLDRMGIGHGIRAFPIQMCATASLPVTIPVLVRAVGHKLSLKKTDDGCIWIGGGWEAAGYDEETRSTTISIQNERGNLAAAANVVPALTAAAVDRRWGGWVAWTRDGLPMVGPCPDAPDVLVACGGNGFSLAPLYSELLTSLAVGDPLLVDLAGFAVDRFDDNGPAGESARAVLPD